MRERGIGSYPRHTLRRNRAWLADTRVRLHLPRQLARDELRALYDHEPPLEESDEGETESPR